MVRQAFEVLVQSCGWWRLLCFGGDSAAAAAPAASTEALFKRFGLFGTWAVDCAAASPDNPHVNITTPSAGLILEDHDSARTMPSIGTALSAEKLSGTQIAVQVIFQPGKDDEERQKLVWACTAPRCARCSTSRRGTGAGRRRRGGGYGVATPVLRKCE